MGNFGDLEFIYYLIVVGWYSIFIYFMAYLHVRYNIPYQPEYKEEYSKEIPSSLTPGSLSFLMYKKIVPEVFTATILVLLKKNILSVRTKGNDYIFTVGSEENHRLSNSQKYVLKFLKDLTNKNNEFSLNDLYNYCNGNAGSSDFLLNYQIWKRLMLKESCKRKFFEDKVEYQKVRLFKYIGLLLFLINIIFGFNLIIGYFLILASYFLPFYFYKIYKRTADANEEYHKWLAFKKYLENINKFDYDKKETDKYLLYAVILKIEKDVSIKFSKKFDNQFVYKLNDAVNRCVMRATLHGNRSIRDFGS